jgi:hypothetical protein
MALCLAAGAVAAALAINSFTLVWMHSIERLRWEEDWRVDAGRLQLVAARIKGSGAGMEPPDDAVLQGGAWHYRPRVAAMDRLTLAHSPYTAGYELCADGACRKLADYLPGIEESTTIVLAPCPE